MLGLNKDMVLITCNDELNARTCNYWYLVRLGGSTPLTAFTHRASLLRWLGERGLSLVELLAPHGTYSCQSIVGSYRRIYHGSYDEFFALRGLRARTLSNGAYTMAIITKDADGEVTENVLNPNCKDRPVYDYATSRDLYG